MNRSPKEASLLRVDNIYLSFGGLKALNGVSFDLQRGEILSLIGPNGSGKTCILNCINRFYRQQEGEIYFEGRPLSHLRPHEVHTRSNPPSNPVAFVGPHPASRDDHRSYLTPL